MARHTLLESLATVEAVVDERAVGADVCVHSLGAEELKQAVQAAYRVMCKLIGLFLVPLMLRRGTGSCSSRSCSPVPRA